MCVPPVSILKGFELFPTQFTGIINNVLAINGDCFLKKKL
jgi:hypothetical protein